eukprot:4893252-Pleurochrysis_carterae.AAC.3
MLASELVRGREYLHPGQLDDKGIRLLVIKRRAIRQGDDAVGRYDARRGTEDDPVRVDVLRLDDDDARVNVDRAFATVRLA